MADQLKAEQDLLQACREWQRLAEAEGEAIRTGNWGLCSACQLALQHLRDRITTLLPLVREEWSRAVSGQANGRQTFSDTLLHLAEIEQKNNTLLHSARNAAQIKMQQLNQAKIKLKQLRRAYGLTAKQH